MVSGNVNTSRREKRNLGSDYVSSDRILDMIKEEKIKHEEQQNIISALQSRLKEVKEEVELKEKQGRRYRRDRELDVDPERINKSNYNTYRNDNFDRRLRKRLRKLSVGTAAVNPGGLNNAADGT